MWPTATTRDHKDSGDLSGSRVRKDGKERMDTLGRVVQANHSTSGNRPEQFETAERQWQTATVSCGGHRQKDGTVTLKLDQQVKAWATPNTMDYMDQRSPEALLRQATTARAGRTMPANLREQVDPQACEIYKKAAAWMTPDVSDRRSDKCRQQGLSNQIKRASVGKLNPRWVETLMGVPVGWAMPSCQKLNDKSYYSVCDNRVDELRLLGNGVCPPTAAKAFLTLYLKLYGE